MKKSWGMIPKILTGEKTIESRWYQTRQIPWNRIHAGDTVFFKNSGEQIVACADVTSVIAFEALTPQKIKVILQTYGRADGIEKQHIPRYIRLFQNKKYCILIFLHSPRLVPKPFPINKTGFGYAAAWLTVKHVSALQKKRISYTQTKNVHKSEAPRAYARGLSGASL